jgi:hypothetical protein
MTLEDRVNTAFKVAIDEKNAPATTILNILRGRLFTARNATSVMGNTYLTAEGEWAIFNKLLDEKRAFVEELSKSQRGKSTSFLKSSQAQVAVLEQFL